MRSRDRDAEIVAVADQITDLLGELAKTVADLNEILTGGPRAADARRDDDRRRG